MVQLNQKRTGWPFLVLILLVCFSDCDRVPKVVEPSHPETLTKLLLKPDSISLSFDTTFTCSIGIFHASQLMAARFHINFDTTNFQFDSIKFNTEVNDAFTDVTLLELNSVADISLIIASHSTLPDSFFAATLHFTTQEKAVTDSIYFNRNAGLTSLRDVRNEVILVDQWGSTKVKIGD